MEPIARLTCSGNRTASASSRLQVPSWRPTPPDRAAARDGFRSLAQDSHRCPARVDQTACRLPSPDQRRGQSLSPANQWPSAGASPMCRYVPPHSQPQFPPPKGPINGFGCQGPKKKKRKGPLHSPTLATPVLECSDVTAGNGPPCFNCSLPGNFQVACPNPPTCYLYKDAGHPAVLCPDRPMCQELMVYGHGIKGLAFFHMNIPDVPTPAPSLCTIVTMLGNGVASLEMIEAELNHLCRCQWDW
ncbi:hypothetical protein ZWY2020_014923 [Hordeum vulgare]|nr:hypothetical protein ZWY2020_014923 [Hordeum vulgare]